MTEHMCKNCGRSFLRWNNLQTTCPKCQYNKQKAPQKPIKKMGKKAKEWATVRADWFREHPADSYECYLCGKYLSVDETTLDHVIPRSNAKNYSNRNEHSNLQPCCYACNGLKGSRRIEHIRWLQSSCALPWQWGAGGLQAKYLNN